MSDAMHPSPVPWLAVEAVLLGLSRTQPASLQFTRDPGDRITRHLRDPVAGEALPRILDAADPGRASCCVWIGDGVTPTAEARVEVVARAARCDHELLLCEPVVPGCGIGLHMLRAIDPHAIEIVTDEIGDGPDRTRERRPWEPQARWIVAMAAVWRFADHAELARDGFLARRGRMAPAPMVLAVRRILARFPNAHELLLLAIDELCSRQDEAGARLLWNELLLHGADAGSVRHRARACILDAFIPDWAEPVRRTG